MLSQAFWVFVFESYAHNPLRSGISRTVQFGHVQPNELGKRDSSCLTFCMGTHQSFVINSGKEKERLVTCSNRGIVNSLYYY